MIYSYICGGLLCFALSSMTLCMDDIIDVNQVEQQAMEEQYQQLGHQLVVLYKGYMEAALVGDKDTFERAKQQIGQFSAEHAVPLVKELLVGRGLTEKAFRKARLFHQTIVKEITALKLEERLNNNAQLLTTHRLFLGQYERFNQAKDGFEMVSVLLSISNKTI